MGTPKKNWKIDDPMFYPLGLFNNAHSSKTIFVAWSHMSIATFIFKKVNNFNTLQKSFNITLDNTIRNIIVTKYNTICLTQEGNVFFFSSCKRLRKINSLSGVRCICSRSDGFGVIRVDERNRIICEIYKDFSPGEDVSAGAQSFDLTFDEINLLQSSCVDEKFCMFSCKVIPESRALLQLLIKEEIKSEEVIFFSIYNNLFYLVNQNFGDSDYQCGLILTVATQIDEIVFLKSINGLLLMTACGSVELIFYSSYLKGLDRFSHILASNIIAKTISEDCMYFSNGTKVVKAVFHYKEGEGTFEIRKQDRQINGIVALSWVTALNKLVCLNENNIFYKIKFVSNPKPPKDEYMLLTSEKYNEIGETIEKLDLIIDEPNRIFKEIENEYNKQEILSIVKHKEIHTNENSAEISVHLTLPELHEVTYYPDDKINSLANTFFAKISIEIGWSANVTISLWNLQITAAGEECCWCRYLKLNSDVIKNKFNILLNMERKQFLIIPKLKIELSTFVEVNKEFVYASIPVPIRKINLENIFIKSSNMIQSCRNRCKTLNQKLFQMAKINPVKIFSAKLKSPITFNIKDLIQMFPTVGTLEAETCKIMLSIFGEPVEIYYNEGDNSIEITSEDPGVLYYTKMHITNRLINSFEQELVTLGDTLKLITRTKTELECVHSSGLSEISETHLGRVYTKLRKENIKPV